MPVRGLVHRRRRSRPWSPRSLAPASAGRAGTWLVGAARLRPRPGRSRPRRASARRRPGAALRARRRDHPDRRRAGRCGRPASARSTAVAEASDDLGRAAPSAAPAGSASAARSRWPAAGLAVAAPRCSSRPAVADGYLSAPMPRCSSCCRSRSARSSLPVADAGPPRPGPGPRRTASTLCSRSPPAVEPPRPPAPALRRHGRSRSTASPRPGTASAVLRDLSTCVPRAATGSASSGRPARGKSTLASLLLRFVDPVAARSASAAVAAARSPSTTYGARVGLVDDDPHVFATTLVENVRLARPERHRRRGRGGAPRQARLGPWLDALPDGLDSWLGDGARRGVRRRARPDRDRPLAARRPAGAGARRADRPSRRRDRRRSSPPRCSTAAVGRTVVWITHDPVGLDRVDAGRRPRPAGLRC